MFNCASGISHLISISTAAAVQRLQQAGAVSRANLGAATCLALKPDRQKRQKSAQWESSP